MKTLGMVRRHQATGDRKFGEIKIDRFQINTEDGQTQTKDDDSGIIHPFHK